MKNIDFNSFFKKSITQNIIIIILFILFSFGIGIFSKQKVSENNPIIFEKIEFIENKEKIISNSNSTVIYIWATWCGVCRTNQPLIKMNYNISNFFNINFISLEEGEDISKLKAYLTDNQLPFPVGLLTDEISNTYDIKEYPSYIYLDKSEHVVLKETGLLNPFSFLLRIIYLKIIK